MKSKVFWTDMRCAIGDSLLAKLRRVMDAAGFGDINFKNKYVAIKIHFGEPGNLAYLRPAWARVVADAVKTAGGWPFLTDCNTLYVGRRNQAIAHMEAAFENGYTPFSTGCHNIIADGLKGTDEVEVPVPGGVYCATARIGRAIMDADIIISLAHFKGHENAGFGGALKNLGMGSGSRAGKMAMHNDGKPHINAAACAGCRTCERYCNQHAISYADNGTASIDTNKCAGCGRCICACPYNAVVTNFDESTEKLSCKVAEYAAAVVAGRPAFHINIVNQVSPYCDCHAENDAPIVPDIGIFAGTDAVALDKACLDAVNAAPVIATSVLRERSQGSGDHFHDVHPTTHGDMQLVHGERIGLGTMRYELVFVK